MFLIYPDEPVTYGADETDPWTYAWIGFKGIRAGSLAAQCGFSRKNRVLPAPSSELITEYIDHLLEHRQLSQANDLRRQAYLLLFFAELTDFQREAVRARIKSH